MPSALVAISAAEKEGSLAPLFSYHAIASSAYDAETISRSPSLSKSATWTIHAPSALESIVCNVKEGFAAPLFSSHEILSSNSDAETISRSPSLSISAATTDRAPSMFVAISIAVNDGSDAPLFSYHAMVSSR